MDKDTRTKKITAARFLFPHKVPIISERRVIIKAWQFFKMGVYQTRTVLTSFPALLLAHLCAECRTSCSSPLQSCASHFPTVSDVDRAGPAGLPFTSSTVHWGAERSSSIFLICLISKTPMMLADVLEQIYRHPGMWWRQSVFLWIQLSHPPLT